MEPQALASKCVRSLAPWAQTFYGSGDLEPQNHTTLHLDDPSTLRESDGLPNTMFPFRKFQKVAFFFRKARSFRGRRTQEVSMWGAFWSSGLYILTLGVFCQWLSEFENIPLAILSLGRESPLTSKDLLCCKLLPKSAVLPGPPL